MRGDLTSKKRRVVALISHSSGLGGSERSLLAIIRALHSGSEYSCHIVLPGDGPLVGELKRVSASYDIVPFSWWTMIRKGRELPILELDNESRDGFLRVLENLKRIRPDLVYSNTLVINTGALVADALGVPHIWHIREFGEIDHGLLFRLPLEERVKFVRRYSDIVIFNSESVRNYYFGTNRKKTVVVYNGIDNFEMEPLSEGPIFRREQSLKLAIVGTIHSGKNQNEAISALANLKRRGVDVELALVGGGMDGKYAIELRDRLRKRCLSDTLVIKMSEAERVL